VAGLVGSSGLAGRRLGVASMPEGGAAMPRAEAGAASPEGGAATPRAEAGAAGPGKPDTGRTRAKAGGPSGSDSVESKSSMGGASRNGSSRRWRADERTDENDTSGSGSM